MTLRCWVGCLAFVIDGRAYPENVGALVRVLRPSDAPGANWFIRGVGCPLVGEDLFGRRGSGYFADCADAQLQPIRPPAEPITTTRDIEEPQHA